MMRILLFLNFVGVVLSVWSRENCSYAKSWSKNGESGRYEIHWAVLNDEIHFILYHKPIPSDSRGFWTGVGFGQSMDADKADFSTNHTFSHWDQDFIQVTHHYQSLPTLVDTHLRGYSTPIRDAIQNVMKAWCPFDRCLDVGYDAGRLVSRFYRKLTTTDTDDDKNLSLKGCQYFSFPYSGGPLSFTHHRTPEVVKICNLGQCVYDRCFAPPHEGNLVAAMAALPRYYYDRGSNNCKSMHYVGWPPSDDNNFRSIQQCQDACVMSDEDDDVQNAPSPL